MYMQNRVNFHNVKILYSFIAHRKEAKNYSKAVVRLQQTIPLKEKSFFKHVEPHDTNPKGERKII